MIYIITTICYIFWILYSFIEGVREANFEEKKETSKSNAEMKSRLHNIQRICVISVISILLFPHIKFLSILMAISMLLVFPFIHNGVYLLTRNQLNPKRFICQDSNEKLTIKFSHKIRIRAAIIGILLLIITFFLI